MADQKRIVILLTGGGTGGHIYPLLAIAEELDNSARRNNFILDLRYLGPAGPYRTLLEAKGIKVNSLISAKWRRYLNVGNLIDAPKFVLGLIQAFIKVFWIMPDVIFSKGGPGALTAVIAGWFYRIPIIIHESDSVPGMTNLISARFVKKIAVSFQKAMDYFPANKTILTGNPVRAELLVNRETQEEAKNKLGFDSKKPMVLILGGSQGSQRINEFIIANLGSILQQAQVFHQVGAANYKEMEKLRTAFLQNRPALEYLAYKITPYLVQELKTALTAANLIVSRAGAGAIFESAAFGKPMILIPLPESAQDHQRANSHEAVKAGFAAIIEEENFLPGIFIGQLKHLLANPELLRTMSEKAAKFINLGAGKIIAGEILRLAKTGP